ncbi:MAG: hypothetical protein IJL27_03680, partial [Firmicutes bacterium]|nr:hypothetical protein [Bacillota bacterium]
TMDELMGAADVIVSRAGATTIAESRLGGLRKAHEGEPLPHGRPFHRVALQVPGGLPQGPGRRARRGRIPSDGKAQRPGGDPRAQGVSRP